MKKEELINIADAENERLKALGQPPLPKRDLVYFVYNLAIDNANRIIQKKVWELKEDFNENFPPNAEAELSEIINKLEGDKIIA